MIEPSEDSFETMMERKNPSSKQMESSEGSFDRSAGTSGGPAQGTEEPPSGSLQETEELPSDLLQDMEKTSSGPHHNIEDPPNDLLQDTEESCDGAHAETDEDEADEDEAPCSPPGAQGGGECSTDLIPFRVQQLPEDQEVEASMRALVSLYIRVQGLREQQRAAAEPPRNGFSLYPLSFPAPFSGNRREYREFILLCQLVLQSHPRLFSDNRLHVGYIVSHLLGLALEWIKALLQCTRSLMGVFPGFLDAVSNTFEHRQAVRLAEEAMFAIRQRNRPALAYITEFQSLVPTLGWPDEVLQAHLCQGLNEDIRHYLFRVPQPDSLESLITVILQIEEKLAERRALLRLPPESRPRNWTRFDSPSPERWTVSSWPTGDVHPDIDRAHIFLLVMIRVNPYHSIAVRALVDSGASGNFMDERFAQEHYVALYRRPYPQAAWTVDGSLIGSGPVWLYTEPLVCIHQNHQESLEFNIVPSPNFSVILGTDWLRVHTPEVDWVKGRCSFHSPYCLQNCLRPPPPCIALERHGLSLLPGLPPPYSDLADVFNPRAADEETSDQPSSDGSDDLSESEPSELQQAGDSDHGETFYECPSTAPWGPVGAGMQDRARLQDECWDPRDMLTNRQDYVQMIPELFDQLHGAAWFTKLELRGTVVRESTNIHRAEDVWRAAFGFKPQEMESYRPFKLSPDPVIPQRVIHFILKDMLGFFVLSYGQDVLIYSMSREQHPQHVREVLVRLRHHHVYCALDRSQFHQQAMEFLGFVITPEGVKLSKSTVAAVTGYPTPSSRGALRHLIDFTFPYRHFVALFMGIIEPLLRQLLGSQGFSWGAEEQEAFKCLKRAFRKAPLLRHPRPQDPFYLEADVTRSALHASLIQIDRRTGKMVPCAFYSRPLAPTELTESSRLQRRVLPIWAAFTVWRRYLENTEEPIMIRLKTEDLASLNNDRLTVLLPGHWVVFFSHFHFDVAERPEREGGRPQLPTGSLNPGALRHVTDPRVQVILATGGSLPESEEEEDNDEGILPQGEPHGPNAQLQQLARLPIHQILDSFLSRFNPEQIRDAPLSCAQDLLTCRDALALATFLLLLKLQRHLPLLLPPEPRAERTPPRRPQRLTLDTAGIARGDFAAAIARLLAQMPPLTGTTAALAEEIAELLLGPSCWRQSALLPGTRQGLQLTPRFWLMLRELWGVGVTLREGGRWAPPVPHHPALHGVGDEDVVSREALQDDLQRYHHCGLHDGLQDTPQDAQDNGVPGALPADATRALQPRRPRASPQILAIVNDLLLYVHGADGQLDLLNRGRAARATADFLGALQAQATPGFVWMLQPGQMADGASPGERPNDDNDSSRDADLN
ncbi:retrotransposon-like protein 1 [Choloepus didactylus]|uniref:retrotransposon-like protein 1 n=1 Tax=Choloepus didactylus TaxID=27675 RepID=UPI00189D8A5B|nr:retrotransposon-like protein 1 [Choloepus didactylus]